VPRIEAAISKLRGDSKIDITVVVCTKRHDARFFLANIPRNAVRLGKEMPFILKLGVLLFERF